MTRRENSESERNDNDPGEASGAPAQHRGPHDHTEPPHGDRDDHRASQAHSPAPTGQHEDHGTEAAHASHDMTAMDGTLNRLRFGAASF